MRLVADALRDLRAHRARSTLAALSLFVAILSLVAVTTIGTLARDMFIAQDEQHNGRLWTIVATMEYGSLTPERLTAVTAELDQRIVATGGAYALTAELPGSAAVAPEAGVRFGSAPVRLLLVAGELDLIRRLPLLAGTWPSTSGADAFSSGVVVNQAASTVLGDPGTRLEVVLDDRVRPDERRVTGVISDGNAEPRVYLSLPSALHLQPALGSGPLQLELFVHYPGASQAEIEAQIEAVADAIGAPPESVQIHAASGLAQFLASLRQLQVAFAAVAAVMLLVAAIGLLNIGLATLRERVKELSLRRALGATRSRVFGLVLASTLMLSMAVAAIAIALAYAGVQWWVPVLLEQDAALTAPSFPWQAALYAGGAALLAGIAGGVVPALAAARVDMAQVLRE